MHKDDKYAEFVEHPRFGRGPRITGLDPDADDWNVNVRGIGFLCEKKKIRMHEKLVGKVDDFTRDLLTRSDAFIPGTALKADRARQHSPVPYTHYYDLERKCRDCKRPFIFFAEEQKHWYETLGFDNGANAVRCPQCRKNNQALVRRLRRYEVLLKQTPRTEAETLELAECAITLLENGAFATTLCQRIRSFLKKVPEPGDLLRKHGELRQRLVDFEKATVASPSPKAKPNS